MSDILYTGHLSHTKYEGPKPKAPQNYGEYLERNSKVLKSIRHISLALRGEKEKTSENPVAYLNQLERQLERIKESFTDVFKPEETGQHNMGYFFSEEFVENRILPKSKLIELLRQQDNPIVDEFLSEARKFHKYDENYHQLLFDFLQTVQYYRRIREKIDELGVEMLRLTQDIFEDIEDVKPDEDLSDPKRPASNLHEDKLDLTKKNLVGKTDSYHERAELLQKAHQLEKEVKEVQIYLASNLNLRPELYADDIPNGVSVSGHRSIPLALFKTLIQNRRFSIFINIFPNSGDVIQQIRDVQAPDSSYYSDQHVETDELMVTLLKEITPELKSIRNQNEIRQLAVQLKESNFGNGLYASLPFDEMIAQFEKEGDISYSSEFFDAVRTSFGNLSKLNRGTLNSGFLSLSTTSLTNFWNFLRRKYHESEPEFLESEQGKLMGDIIEDFDAKMYQIECDLALQDTDGVSIQTVLEYPTGETLKTMLTILCTENRHYSVYQASAAILNLYKSPNWLRMQAELLASYPLLDPVLDLVNKYALTGAISNNQIAELSKAALPFMVERLESDENDPAKELFCSVVPIHDLLTEACKRREISPEISDQVVKSREKLTFHGVNNEDLAEFDALIRKMVLGLPLMSQFIKSDDIVVSSKIKISAYCECFKDVTNQLLLSYLCTKFANNASRIDVQDLQSKYQDLITLFDEIGTFSHLEIESLHLILDKFILLGKTQNVNRYSYVLVACINAGKVEIAQQYAEAHNDVAFQRAHELFGSYTTVTTYNIIKRLLNDDEVPPQLDALGVSEVGEAGLDQFRVILKRFKQDLFEPDFDPKLPQHHQVLADYFKAIIRYNISQFGAHGDADFLKIIRNYRYTLLYRQHKELPDAYQPTHFEVKARQSSSEKPQYTAEFTSKFTFFQEVIRESLEISKSNKALSINAEKIAHEITQTILPELKAKYAELPTSSRFAEMKEQAKEKALYFLADRIQKLSSLDTRSVKEFAQNFAFLYDQIDDKSLAVALISFALKLNPNLTELATKLSQVNNPTKQDINEMIEFIEHNIKHETWKIANDALSVFKTKQQVKSFQQLFNVSALVQELDNQDKKGEIVTQHIDAIPTNGILLEFSGHIADACWANQYQLISQEFPNMLSVSLIQDKGKESEMVVGAFLLIETTSFKGIPLLVIRGLNPIMNFVTQVDLQDFYDNVVQVTKQMATKQNRQVAIVIDDHAGGSSTNRPNLFNFLTTLKPQLQKIILSDQDTTFNGYDITQDTYLI